MIEAILLTATVVFAVLGICDFLHTIKTAFLFPGIKTDNYSVVFLKEKYAVCQLRFFSAKLRWYGSEYANGIIALTDELSPGEIALCERYCYGTNIYLCRFGDIGWKLNRIIGDRDEGQPVD